MFAKLFASSVATLLCGQAMALNLVTNGNFEIGSLAGWTLDEGSALVEGIAPNHVAMLGSSSVDDYAFQLSQLIFTPPSASPLVSFDWGTMPSLTSQSLLFSIETQVGTIFSTVISAEPSTTSSLAHYTFSFPASGQLPIRISFTNITGADAVAQLLDNVSVVPEPGSAALAVLGLAFLGARRRALGPAARRA